MSTACGSDGALQRHVAVRWGSGRPAVAMHITYDLHHDRALADDAFLDVGVCDLPTAPVHRGGPHLCTRFRYPSVVEVLVFAGERIGSGRTFFNGRDAEGPGGGRS